MGRLTHQNGTTKSPTVLPISNRGHWIEPGERWTLKGRTSQEIISQNQQLYQIIKYPKTIPPPM